MNRICTICDSVFLCLFLQQDVQTRHIEKTKETNCYFRILFEEHFKKGSLTKGALGTNKKLVDINRPEDLINVTSALSGFHDQFFGCLFLPQQKSCRFRGAGESGVTSQTSTWGFPSGLP